MGSNDYINMRISEEIKEKAMKLAKADDRTLSNYIISLLKREIEKAEAEGRL